MKRYDESARAGYLAIGAMIMAVLFAIAMLFGAYALGIANGKQEANVEALALVDKAVAEAERAQAIAESALAVAKKAQESEALVRAALDAYKLERRAEAVP